MNQPLPVADPNVKMPPAVAALAAAAQARQEAFINDLANDFQAPAAEEEEQPSLPGFEAGGQVQTPPEPKPAPPREDPVEEESYKQKFLSAQGRLEKAQTRLSELSEQIASMQNAMHELQARATVATPAPTQTYKKLITPEEETEFGTEFLDVVARKAQEVLEPVKAEYEQKIAGLEAQVKGSTARASANARERLESSMDESLPTWRQINYQQEFLDWLKLPDPYSGGIRMNMLRAAFEQNDTPRVRAFFKGFLAEEAATTPAGNQPDHTPPPADGGTGKVSLESLAAPGRAKTAATAGVPTEKPVFTRAQVTQFYVDVSAGRFKGREDERKRLDQQIFEAGNEGRIR